MGLLQVIKQRWNSHITLPEIADNVADQCIDAVWQRVQCQVASLAPAEARGYIRARGVAIVQPKLARESVEQEVVEQLRPQLYALTVEAVIRQVQLRVRENASQPRFRRAA